jgi:hypothetical protein
MLGIEMALAEFMVKEFIINYFPDLRCRTVLIVSVQIALWSGTLQFIKLRRSNHPPTRRVIFILLL